MLHVREMSVSLRHSSGAMSIVRTRRTFLGALALVLAGAGSAYSDDRNDGQHDHDRARRALEEGRAPPLAEILARVRSQLDGEVAGVEFERKRGRYVYEFKVVTSTGKLREVYVDAMTAEIVKSEDD
jgi:uncharacterized membrane protein YkoI